MNDILIKADNGKLRVDGKILMDLTEKDLIAIDVHHPDDIDLLEKVLKDQ